MCETLDIDFVEMSKLEKILKGDLKKIKKVLTENNFKQSLLYWFNMKAKLLFCA